MGKIDGVGLIGVVNRRSRSEGNVIDHNQRIGEGLVIRRIGGWCDWPIGRGRTCDCDDQSSVRSIASQLFAMN